MVVEQLCEEGGGPVLQCSELWSRPEDLLFLTHCCSLKCYRSVAGANSRLLA